MSTLKQEGSGQNMVSGQVARFSRVSRKRQGARTAGVKRDEKRILGVVQGGLGFRDSILPHQGLARLWQLASMGSLQYPKLAYCRHAVTVLELWYYYALIRDC